MLERLGEIRAAIAGEIADADGLDAVRAALSRLFASFVLHPQQNPKYEGSGRAQLVDVDNDLMIELVVRETVLAGYDEHLSPVLRREPLHGNNQGVGLAANSRACSASERKADVTDTYSPASARAAAAMRSKAAATSGRIGLPTSYLFGPIPV